MWRQTGLLGTLLLVLAGCSSSAAEDEGAERRAALDERLAEEHPGLVATACDAYERAANAASSELAEALADLDELAPDDPVMRQAYRRQVRAECQEAVAGANTARRSQAEAPDLAQREAPEPVDDAEDASSAPGTDAALDRLWDRCAEGDMPACDDLYMESEWGSGYEAFGESCGERRADRSDGVWCEDVFESDGANGSSERATEDEGFYVMQAVWETTPPEERHALCVEMRKGDSEAIAVGNMISDASNGTVTAFEAVAFLRVSC